MNINLIKQKKKNLNIQTSPNRIDNSNIPIVNSNKYINNNLIPVIKNEIRNNFKNIILNHPMSPQLKKSNLVKY